MVMEESTTNKKFDFCHINNINRISVKLINVKTMKESRRAWDSNGRGTLLSLS